MWVCRQTILFILQGGVAVDPDDEDVPVIETFWCLQEVLYFDQHICLVRKAHERRLFGQSFWGIQRHQNWRGQEKSEEILFLVNNQK